MKNGVSVVIITKNEEANIEDCLELVKWANEIVVVDSYSTDKTVDICRMYTNKVFLREFDGYGTQRNFAAEQAVGPWIFVVDADERVPRELRDEILAVVSDESHGCVAFLIPTLDYMFGKMIRHGGWYPQYHVRLYKKGHASWKGTVHEKLEVVGKIGYLKTPILHYSHHTISGFVQKMDRYTSLEAEDLWKQGKRASILRMLGWPILVFCYKYFLKLGFLDGVHGLVLAVSLAYYHFLKHAKLWEMDFKARQKLEIQRTQGKNNDSA